MAKKPNRAKELLNGLPPGKHSIDRVLGKEAVAEIREAVAEVMQKPITERPSLNSVWANLENAYKTGYGKGAWEPFLKKNGWQSE